LVDNFNQQQNAVNNLIRSNNLNDVQKQLRQLAQSFRDSTGLAQDGAANAVADCFLPLKLVAGNRNN
jgi:hypothetical protein